MHFLTDFKGELKMEFIFVETEEFREFKEDLKLMIKMWKRNFWAYLIGSVLFYICLVMFIIIL